MSVREGPGAARRSVVNRARRLEHELRLFVREEMRDLCAVLPAQGEQGHRADGR